MPKPLVRTRRRLLAGALTLATGIALVVAAPHASSTTPQTSRLSAAAPLGPNVYVFTPDMPQAEIQATVDSIAAAQVSNQFGPERYALLFAPGTYGSADEPLRFQVGYYTEVAGLGSSPTDVTINGSIDVYNQCDAGGCIALNNFWRSLSNLTIDVAGGDGCQADTEFWAVSQASPMRRVNVVGGKFTLMDYCGDGPYYASGGFIADSAVSDTVVNGSQQQFFTRDSSIGSWSNGVWNQVFAGVQGAPAQSFGEPGKDPYTTLPTTGLTQEKPFLTWQGGKFSVFVPAVRNGASGPSWTGGATAGRSIPLDRFLVADPSTSVASINQALANGKNLLLTPGVYNLDRSIVVSRARTVVLGLGMPTLVPQHGGEALRVGNVPAVKISGMIVDAGPQNSADLVQLGCANCAPASKRNDPTTMQDVYFRVGGASAGRATTALVVNSSDVLLDNLWVWRADHGAGVGWDENVSDTGVIVNGDRVNAYGLFVEHFEKQNVIWNGQDGSVVFFQNEMAYDVPSQSAWMASRAVKGYPAFQINSGVKTFTGWGMGSYCFFNQGVDIHATQAFQTPTGSGIHLHDLLTIFLNASASGGIDSVVNGVGGPVSAANADVPSIVVSYP